jgi:hypothetical protein
LEVSSVIQSFGKLEEKAIFTTLAMMSYNPSIGRVFRKGGVNGFILIMQEEFPRTKTIRATDEFDVWHDQTVKKIANTIATTSTGKKISYGQAQKPINVFLKVYVDWAGLPTIETATKLRPFLHVPIDSVVMKFTKQSFPKYYEKHNLKVTSLANINKDQYYSWQECFRELCPNKPLILDMSWALERFGLSS